jgi:hypothetical protein
MTNEKKSKDLTAKQVQAINTATAGVFNGLQQAALLRALHVAQNPHMHEDAPQADPEDAQKRAEREAREQAKRDADAVERAQAEARALDEAQATPNVLNQGNYDNVVESTREAVKARDPDVVKENLAEGRTKAPAKKTK